MTDRHMGYVVVLDSDLRTDDAQDVINALRMVRGVQAVTPVVSEVSVAMLAEQRTRLDLRQRVLRAVLNEFDANGNDT